MSAYLIGLLTVPAILAITLGLWALLTVAGKALVNTTTLVGRDSDWLRRSSMGGLIATADRAVMVRFGSRTVIVFARGERVDDEKFRRAKNALWDHGSEPVEYLPVDKPGRKTESGPCPVTGESPCPYHPDGGNHPIAGSEPTP